MNIKEALQQLDNLLTSGMVDVLKESDKVNDEHDLEALRVIREHLHKLLD